MHNDEHICIGNESGKEFSSPSFREAFSRRALIVSSVQIQGWFIVSGLKYLYLYPS